MGVRGGGEGGIKTGMGRKIKQNKIIKGKKLEDTLFSGGVKT